MYLTPGENNSKGRVVMVGPLEKLSGARCWVKHCTFNPKKKKKKNPSIIFSTLEVWK